MEIYSRGAYPAGALSNFAPHAFRFRGLPVSCMEGLLQGLKFADPTEQARVLMLDGPKAKKAGAQQDWVSEQTLYWQGSAIDRHGREYQTLLDEAFAALFEQNVRARRALLSSGDAVLEHTVGKTDASDTILTRSELCERLTHLRASFRETH